MTKTISRIITLTLVLILLSSVCCINALAEPIDESVPEAKEAEPSADENIPASPGSGTPAINPSGTVVAMSKDDSEISLYAIQTADEHSFFLIVSGSDVYFLNAVKSEDLFSLIEEGKSNGGMSIDPHTPAEPRTPFQLSNTALIGIASLAGALLITIILHYIMYKKRKNLADSYMQALIEDEEAEYEEIPPQPRKSVDDTPEITSEIDLNDMTADEIDNHNDNANDFNPRMAKRRPLPQLPKEPEDIYDSDEDADIFISNEPKATSHAQSR